MPDLIPHPQSPDLGIAGVTVSYQFRAEGLALEYRLCGDLQRLKLPPWSGSQRGDRLWEHSCFELFAGEAESSAYREFNFAPSGAWAAYAFSAYREGGAALAQAPSLCLHAEHRAGEYALRLRLPRSLLPARVGRLGLSAVLESHSGEKAYWALTHPAAQPDFHHPAAFALACAE